MQVGPAAQWSDAGTRTTLGAILGLLPFQWTAHRAHHWTKLILFFLSAKIFLQMMKITGKGNKILINIWVQYLKSLIPVRKHFKMKHPNKTVFKPAEIRSTKSWQKHFFRWNTETQSRYFWRSVSNFLQICHYIFPRNCTVPLDPFQSFFWPTR